MTISLVEVQAELIAKIKTMTSVTSLLIKGATDVREVTWQGKDFGYPNVRVRVETFERHISNSACGLFDVGAYVWVFGEDASSKLTNTVATELFNALDTKSFQQGTVKFTGIKAVQSGAGWIEEGGIWRSEVKLNFQAS